jgi:hypothetical protein
MEWIIPRKFYISIIIIIIINDLVVNKTVLCIFVSTKISMRLLAYNKLTVLSF